MAFLTGGGATLLVSSALSDAKADLKVSRILQARIRTEGSPPVSLAFVETWRNGGPRFDRTSQTPRFHRLLALCEASPAGQRPELVRS